MSEERPVGKYAPLSPWAYFGLNILFGIPVVGFIFLIVFSINGNNINRRNFARSFWCVYVLTAIIFAIVLIVMLATGGLAALGAAFSSMG